MTRAAGAPEAALSVASFAAAHGLELVRIAYLLCGDRQRAEDLVQDVLLNLHRRFPEVLTLDNPVGYARRALVNANISRVRARSSQEFPLEVLPERVAPEPDPADRDLLWRAMQALPQRQRAVLVLRYYADLPDEEIATVLGCRRATVRSLAARGLTAMRTDAALRPEGATDV